MARAAQSAHGLSLSKVTEEPIGETARVREREEMATWKLADGDLEALLCHATLELDRKEAIVASGDHMDRYRRPRLESAGLAEHDIGLGALLRLAFLPACAAGRGSQRVASRAGAPRRGRARLP
jgi:hypothetical protein